MKKFLILMVLLLISTGCIQPENTEKLKPLRLYDVSHYGNDGTLIATYERCTYMSVFRTTTLVKIKLSNGETVRLQGGIISSRQYNRKGEQ